jgi:hypothetical protein
MERLSMRKIREVLRLKFELGMAERQIAKSIQVSRSTIADYVRRFTQSGIAWPLPGDLADVSLETKLFPPKPALPDALRPLPDWALIHQELRKKGVTLFLLRAERAEGQAFTLYFALNFFISAPRSAGSQERSVYISSIRAISKCGTLFHTWN